LGERTRLAQELHDTVEQTLTGIALQLDTAAKLYEGRPVNARVHLDLARNLMAKSQVELRRSVWDLRQRALEQFDLPDALLESARQITQAAGIKVELQSNGATRALPEVVEENLLRIAQEALTNVIKHARATQVIIALGFEPQRVTMQVQDNGIGFDLKTCAGPSNGHFGLLGMSERAKRIGGRFVPVSAPGRGTAVRVEVPIGPAEEFQWAAQYGGEQVQAGKRA
jgi:signal transduction histidine kinase